MNRTPKVFYLTFGVFRLSKSWEMQPMAFFIIPNIGKAVFRQFFVFPMLGNSIFADFWFSPAAESRFLPIFDFPREGKLIFSDFLFSLVAESRFSLNFTHHTPTKASFSCFSFIVPLRKPLFPDFRSSYSYESFFFPFFINCTPYLSDFSRKSMIYARIWVVFLIEQFRIVDFQKGICVLTQPLFFTFSWCVQRSWCSCIDATDWVFSSWAHPFCG